ncbi:hypothetical protein NQ317_006334 [Molorchus minor]|uniref:DDE Tnp4 domain-containing protein n=1 Tax=Molorchus minor TaxID=1323400 RepID=A0ABQ9J551_9CUCU|nr:hypothetical protein NQ317_006334 [Molorchus minor]
MGHEEVSEEKDLTVEDMQLALRSSNEEIYKLREKLSMFQMDIDYFKNSDSNTLYYTGLPTFMHLNAIYDLVKCYMAETSQAPLKKFQQLILTLIKLRLNLPFRDLANRFNCHYTSAGRIFSKDIGYTILPFKNLVINMPQCFQDNFGLRTTVLIDCFEVFIERPSNVNAAARTWSNYKHHHTVKFLIGITPQGVICFISNAYGGRASDKFITEDCGFLDKLQPRDLVIADRGFLISNSVNMCLAEVVTPAFLKGKKQLSAKEVESTRKIANVRIHVERIIGMLRSKIYYI